MKTRIIQPTEQEPKTPIKYPCLMRHEDGCIAYAVNDLNGLILTGRDRGYISNGQTDGRWADFNWIPMRGKVVIEFDMEDQP